VLKVTVPNVTKKVVAKLHGLSCVKSVSQENATHLKIHATGDNAFDTIVDALRAEKTQITSIENLQPTLEDVFLHITGRDMRDKADQKIQLQRHGPGGGMPVRRIR
jgi:ABC-2 type transport system ATP-binding protein